MPRGHHFSRRLNRLASNSNLAPFLRALDSNREPLPWLEEISNHILGFDTVSYADILGPLHPDPDEPQGLMIASEKF